MNKQPVRKTLSHMSRALACVWLGILLAVVVPSLLSSNSNLSGIAEAKSIQPGHEEQSQDETLSNNDRVTICHRTGSQRHPYHEITVSRNALPAHLDHDDLYPVPANGCPAGSNDPPTNTPQATDTPEGTNTPPPASTATPVEDRVTICHRTGSERHPFHEITISHNALPAHQGHGDIYPVPANGCPAGAEPPTETPEPNTTATDTPTPGEETATPVADRVTICHRTGSERHPFHEITVSRNALPAHLGHGDIYPVPANGCPAGVEPPTNTPQATETPQGTRTPPASTATPVEDRVTICHRTGSERHPFHEITVSRNALPAHLGHGDIYPVPANGCPAGPSTPSATPEPTGQPSTPTHAATNTPEATRTRTAVPPTHVPTNTRTAIRTSTPVPPTNTAGPRDPEPSDTPVSTATPVAPAATMTAKPAATNTVAPVAAVAALQPAPPAAQQVLVGPQAPRAAVAPAVSAPAILVPISASVLPITGLAVKGATSPLGLVVIAAATIIAGIYIRRRRTRVQTKP